MKINKCKLIFINDGNYECDKLKTPSDIYDFFKEKVNLHKEPEEVVMLLALDNKLEVKLCCEISRGAIDKALLSPREVYKRALVANAKSIVIAHNHPSGEITPSMDDKAITRELKKAGEILDVKLIDHIIVGNKTYYSFFEEQPDLVVKEEGEKFYSKPYNRKEKERS